MSVQAAKKKVSLKAKSKGPNTISSKGDAGILGGADYVSLMMGGRRKAREEAVKIPKDD